MIMADCCVIGAGAAGLSVASGLSQLGLAVVLIEKHKMGGECLNNGCVPSKALISKALEAGADFAAAKQAIKRAITTIEPHDSVERFEGLGVRVIKGAAKFLSPHQIQVNDDIIHARKIVIATGSSPFIPDIKIDADAPVLTNENIFDLEDLPQQLVIIGGGAIGVEMACAFTRLGCAVTLATRGHITGFLDDQSIDVMREALVSLGVTLHENTDVQSISKAGAGCKVALKGREGRSTLIEGSHCLLAIGRRCHFDALGLDKVGIEPSPRGLRVDARLRTSQKHIYALGDAADRPFRTTHAAGYEAGIVIRNLAFRLPAKADLSHIPMAVFSTPQVAMVGVSVRDALKNKRYQIHDMAFSQNDRAICEGDMTGHVKVVGDQKGRIHGVTIIGKNAADHLPLWQLAIKQKLSLSHLAGLTLAYPTRGELSKAIAGAFYAPRLFSPFIRRIVRALQIMP